MEKKLARYISRYLELRLVMKASYNKEVDGRVVTVTGETIRFDGGVYETDNEEIIAFIESRPEFEGNGGEIIRKVPDNIEALAHREEMQKTLEQKEAEIAKLTAENEALKAKGGVVEATEDGPADGLDKMTVAKLKELATSEGFDITGLSTKDDIISAIRAEQANQPQGGAEAEGAAY